MPRYRFHSVQHHATLVGGITKVAAAAAGQLKAEPTSGSIYTQFVHMVSQSPKMEFDVESIGSWLDLCALGGTSIDGLGNGLIFWSAQLAQGSSIAAAGNHRSLTMKSGILVPRSLTVSTQGNAALTYEALVTWDTTNDPYVIADSQNLPSVPLIAETYALGSLALGGVTLDKLASVTLDFGIELDVDPGAGIWPEGVSIKSTIPKLTVRGQDPEWLKSTNIPLAGLACTHANSILYLRRRSSTGFVADVTAQHVKFTFDGTVHVPEPFSASGADAGETNLELVCEHDGTNAPVTIATSTAIT